MKNTLTISVLAFGIMFTSAALADDAKPAKHLKDTIDKMTTQSISQNIDCNSLGATLKHQDVCGPINAAKYPENALSGMNLGF